MTRTIVIDPVTRIEGHAKISVFLDDQGNAEAARFHVVEYRGFEKFCEGRPFTEMAGITARICGICPVSHLLAAAKTGDKILAVQIPPAAENLRRLINLAQIIQSHALSFFHLSSPDFLLGWDSDPARRNLFGLIAADPESARAGIRLRQFGQQLIEWLGGRKIHAAWAVPGGVRSLLSQEGMVWIRDRLPAELATVRATLDRFKRLLDREFREETAVFGDFPSLFMGLVADNGDWEHYGGHLRFVDSQGRIIADRLREDDYASFLGEAVEPWSYLKFPYYKPWGYPEGMYRVGPLARLNVCDRIGTGRGGSRATGTARSRGGTVTSSFLYHYARLVEILASLEKIAEMVEDPNLQTGFLRSQAGVNCLEAIGVSEAPRGTLFHHYRVDSHGKIERVNLIIATGQNNLAMNRTVTQIAQHYIRHGEVQESFLNRVEAGIRCFDPCLSCSTHTAGQMPLKIEIFDSRGELYQCLCRDL
ncbi:NAD-reducing hydrogenase HoxS beta subunit [Synechococcus elongatus PCC 6301]|uniref:HoxH protein n=1 Tax=Synechococcus sp. (strain ATCC 27144 / PCC 6301 / SAUG 1402/1) TaxID=269084 RepID=P94159_SYNP6|nr:Ni/Fe hydrogenase subunit alpha [Synechococcus elongatus]pir/S74233/ bidirectional hydrogenase chain H - Synechococcus sp. (PCC 6301) [Synechococcus sp.]BAD79745.1 NAD-reducing hydrogenase HoxS beta subunit [Synechococcus elongatus PCC 6301]CAA66383.1 hoxH [Synechococcus elongatus PCC 6301]